MKGYALYRLLNFMSPAFPVGAFAYSHGLEWAVDAGTVRDRESLVNWLGGILLHGAGHVDAALFAAAWRARAESDEATLDAVAVLAGAWRGTAELALETGAQGQAFAGMAAAAWGDETLAKFAARHDGKLSVPVAAGAALAPDVPLPDALLAYLSAFAANIVSAAVRLVPLGQTDGQLALAALAPVVAGAAKAAFDADLETIGTATPMVDLASMCHETQYTRIFRS